MCVIFLNFSQQIKFDISFELSAGRPFTGLEALYLLETSLSLNFLDIRQKTQFAPNTVEHYHNVIYELSPLIYVEN